MSARKLYTKGASSASSVTGNQENLGEGDMEKTREVGKEEVSGASPTREARSGPG